jgi:hypothetical protein
MEDEVQLAEAPAPKQVETVTPDPVETVPEEKPAEVAKTFTQEELDAAIGKRLAREQRKWERENAQRAAETQVVKAPTSVSQAEFESPEAYAEALAYSKAEELVVKREAAKQQSQVLEAYHEKEEEARGKYHDFEQVAYNPQVPITDVMAEAIRYSDVGPDVAYYLGTNVKEAQRISRLTPLMQAKEIGKIEAKLASDPPVKKTTSAPAPLSPVTARSVGAPSYDTTDPRSIKTMSTSDWIAADRAREMKKLEARQYR